MWGQMSGTRSSTCLDPPVTCHIPFFFNGPLSKTCQCLLMTTQASAQRTWSAAFARVSTATAGKRMEAIRATALRDTTATLMSPMDAKVTTDFTQILIRPHIHAYLYSLVCSPLLERLPLLFMFILIGYRY